MCFLGGFWSSRYNSDFLDRIMAFHVRFLLSLWGERVKPLMHPMSISPLIPSARDSDALLPQDQFYK